MKEKGEIGVEGWKGEVKGRREERKVELSKRSRKFNGEGERRGEGGRKGGRWIKLGRVGEGEMKRG